MECKAAMLLAAAVTASWPGAGLADESWPDPVGASFAGSDTIDTRIREAAHWSSERYHGYTVETDEDVELENRAAARTTYNLGNRLQFISSDGDFSIRLGGRLKVDAAGHDNDIVDHSNGGEFRQIRLFVAGILWRDWAYLFSYNFLKGSGADGITSAYIDHNGLGPVHMRLGQFKEPFSLQNMTSSNYVNFIERSLPHTFATDRNLGIGLFAGDPRWSIGGGLFGPDIAGESGDKSFGASGRLTYAPVNHNGHVVHLGGSLSYRDTGSDETLSFDAQPESNVTDVRLVNSSNPTPVDANDFYRYGLEAAWVRRRFAMQGEYLRVSVNRALAERPDVSFSGYYVEATWFLTDDTLNYSGEEGDFDEIRPSSVIGKDGIGAWQLGIRFSNLDLNDADINGGEEDNLTFGLNWFPNANLRFSANYTRVLNVIGGPFPGDEPGIFTVRGQVVF